MPTAQLLDQWLDTLFTEPSSAVFDEANVYRYGLGRRWNMLTPSPRFCNFIMLNPSTADARENDPTIRRCIGFARRWGYDGLIVTNLFAFRATEPKDMHEAPEPNGPDNDAVIQEVALRAATIISAWGAHGTYLRRGEAVVGMLRGLGMGTYCLGRTSTGEPKHPLYLPATAPRMIL
jgi:hypothetical protein